MLIITAITTAGPTPRIINGKVAKPGEIPYQVYSKYFYFSYKIYFMKLFKTEENL